MMCTYLMRLKVFVSAFFMHSLQSICSGRNEEKYLMETNIFLQSIHYCSSRYDAVILHPFLSMFTLRHIVVTYVHICFLGIVFIWGIEYWYYRTAFICSLLAGNYNLYEKYWIDAHRRMVDGTVFPKADFYFLYWNILGMGLPVNTKNSSAGSLRSTIPLKKQLF